MSGRYRTSTHSVSASHTHYAHSVSRLPSFRHFPFCSSPPLPSSTPLAPLRSVDRRSTVGMLAATTSSDRPLYPVFSSHPPSSHSFLLPPSLSLSSRCCVQSRPAAPPRVAHRSSSHSLSSTSNSTVSSSGTSTAVGGGSGNGGGVSGRTSSAAPSPRVVPLHLYLECQSARTTVRHSGQQTQLSEWREEKTQAEFVPYLLPAVSQSEAGSQSDSSELFDWDSSLDSLLHSLVGKSCEQALVEVGQEEKWAHTQRKAADYDSRLAADQARVKQMERQEAERRQRLQLEVESARAEKQRQHRLLSQQLAAANDSRTMTARMQTTVKDILEAANSQQERAAIETLLHNNIILSSAVPLHVEASKARAAIDLCLNI